MNEGSKEGEGNEGKVGSIKGSKKMQLRGKKRGAFKALVVNEFEMRGRVESNTKKHGEKEKEHKRESWGRGRE